MSLIGINLWLVQKIAPLRLYYLLGMVINDQVVCFVAYDNAFGETPGSRNG